MIITENGLGEYEQQLPDKSVNDEPRIAYLREHIKAIKNAIEDGVDVIGYMPWSAIDIVSAGTGEFKKKIRLYLCVCR